MALVSGEPGIGKSHLTAALQDRLRGEPHIRVRHFCSLLHRDSALYPFIAQLERAGGFERGDEAAARLDKLEALLAKSGEVNAARAGPLADLLGLAAESRYPPSPLDDPQRRRETTLTALIEEFARLARQTPVLLIFEDAHWADLSSARTPRSDRRVRFAFARVADRHLPAGVLAALGWAAACLVAVVEPIDAARNGGSNRRRNRR